VSNRLKIDHFTRATGILVSNTWSSIEDTLSRLRARTCYQCSWKDKAVSV